MNLRTVAALALVLAGCSPPADDLADGMMVLPPVLHEISGMAVIDEHTIACVQDELGAIFLIDLRGEEPIRRVSFGPNGDYEGVAYTGSEYWVLRSDGVLLQLAVAGDGMTIATTHRLSERCEYEGLCFDEGAQRLLALPKGRISNQKKERDRRRIYAFDLETGRPIERPVVTLRVDDLVDQARERGMQVPLRTTKKGNEKADLELRGSEIAVAPGDGALLLLSSTDNLLVCVDREGQLLATRALDPVLLPQPEAMAFLPDGRLIVASEGRRGPAVISVVDGYR